VATGFDFLVGAGERFTTLTAALAAMVAGDSCFVRGGQTYSESPDINKAVHVQCGPQTVFTALTVSATKASVLVGNGSTLGVLTISGPDNWIKMRNGVLTSGVVITGTGDRPFIDGGGWGSEGDGGTARAGINIQAGADDAIIQNFLADTDTGGTGEAAIDVAAARCTLRLVQVRDSEEAGVDLAAGADDCLLEGVEVLGADAEGFLINGLRTRIIAPHALAYATAGLSLGATGDDSVAIGGVFEASQGAGAEVIVDDLAENCVVVANRVFGTISDASATSTIAFNDLGTATCTVTGTWQAAAALESEIVAGGKTLILTLANAVWINPVPAGSVWRALFDSAQAEAAGWDARESVILADAAFVRTSDTVVTITLQADAGYAITANETITLSNLDSTVLASEDTITPNDVSFAITNE